MIKKASFGVLAVSMVLSLFGCSNGPVAPQKPWTNTWGDLVWVEDAKIDTVYKTVLKTLDEMKFTVTREQQDGLSGEVIAKTLNNKKIVIHLSAETADWTRVSISVGFYWMNEDEARVIYERIHKNL
jgi:hypothetical protein